jgi:hypothetical protein
MNETLSDAPKVSRVQAKKLVKGFSQDFFFDFTKESGRITRPAKGNTFKRLMEFVRPANGSKLDLHSCDAGLRGIDHSI